VDSLSAGIITVASKLESIDETYLTAWFVNEYIGKCAQHCSNYVLRLFEDAHTKIKLQNAVSAIIQFRIDTSLRDMWNAVSLEKSCLETLFNEKELNERAVIYLMNGLTKCDEGLYLSQYLSAIAFLDVACKISRHGINENLVNILATVLGQLSLSDTQRYSKHHPSVLCLNKAAKLMKVVANTTTSTAHQIQTELSKEYLHRALKTTDSDSDSIYCLANVYLAALYYTTGQHQTAIDHCALVTTSRDHSQCSSNVVQGELLPKIDDNVDSIVGLAIFYQYVLSSTITPQQHKHVSVFTTEMFACYLQCRILTATRCREVTQTFDVGRRYAKFISEMRCLYICDVLVFKSYALEQNICDNPEWRVTGGPAVNANESNHYDLVDLLQRSAVEHMTAFRQLEARDFGSIATIVSTDYEALYAYKLGDYQRCLQLSIENVRKLINVKVMANIGPADYMFNQLWDDGIVSLTALILIVNPKFRKEDRPNCYYITQLSLSLYLMTQCQLKLRHSVTSLLQTLDYIEVARKGHSVTRTLDQLTLKLAKCKVATHLRTKLGN